MPEQLVDALARQMALLEHDRTLLVEAGAGSGKTAVLAGRIAVMLAAGIEPKAIAAVTFTELAASELLLRVRAFVSRLRAGEIPRELRLAFASGLSSTQLSALNSAELGIDDITCSTIHGFCQRLIRPYPVEANVDPGASIMDADQATLAFGEIVRDWLREQLDGDTTGLLAELMLEDPNSAAALVDTVLEHQRQHEGLQPPTPPELSSLLRAFNGAVRHYSAFIAGASVKEVESAECAAAFEQMSLGLAQLNISTPSGLTGLVLSKAAPVLCKADGGFKAYKKKGKWEASAKQVGRSKSEGEALNLEAQGRHEQCCQAWSSLLAGAAAQVLHDLMPILQPAIKRLRDYKRSAGLLDFDDLIHAARSLLRSHPEVRAALGAKYRYVLVDEFQDTDPIQTEIFWRLCGEPPAGGDDADWRSYRIRPGALFLVGDPKQAIYRFRGADVQAYVWARSALTEHDAQSVISIAVNFRSRAPILEFVNQRFAGPLNQSGQPGFFPLEVFHPGRESVPSVVALDVVAADENGKASADRVRDAEAEAVAKFCAHLIGNEHITDPATGERRLYRAGDIALLAPTGADLWRYEQALESWGIAVASQAGKGLFRRQEIQDLIAITRVLADGRDTLALGGLLRGPLVGLTDEELLDMVWAQRDEENGRSPALSLSLDSQQVVHPVARETFLKLLSLRRNSRGTTPHNLLSQAVNEFRVRPILLQRYGRQAERALANVDLFLNLSRAYDVRGLSAFADAVSAAWEDDSRAVEGRPDAQEEAVALYTMHAAKGLEWPVVIPINGMTAVKAAATDVVVRDANKFYCPVFGVAPTGHEAALEAEKCELERERVRLWYVAATRARELMVIPRIDVPVPSNAWKGLVDLDVGNLEAYELPDDVAEVVSESPDIPNVQTAEQFADEASRIASAQRELVWVTPSRDENPTKPLLEEEMAAVFVESEARDGADLDMRIASIQGGRQRGLVLHKLLEEVLTGEVEEDGAALTVRALELARMLGAIVAEDPSEGISPSEIAESARRALAVEPVAAIRPLLVPELPVYAADSVDGKEVIRSGVMDAVALNRDGSSLAVIDWKSDVKPTEEGINHYVAQVRAYLDMTDTPRGYVVFATTGEAHEVLKTSA